MTNVLGDLCGVVLHSLYYLQCVCMCARALTHALVSIDVSRECVHECECDSPRLAAGLSLVSFYPSFLWWGLPLNLKLIGWTRLAGQ